MHYLQFIIIFGVLLPSLSEPSKMLASHLTAFVNFVLGTAGVTTLMIGTAGATTLVMETARITNPSVSHEKFNKWYNTVYLPDFMTTHNASLAVRYKVAPGPTTSWQYLSLYKIHQADKSSAIPKSNWDNSKKSDIKPNDVVLESTTWNQIQIFESLREKRGEVPNGRPKIAMVVKIEPREGGEEELEEWYRKQVRIKGPANVLLNVGKITR